MSSVCAAAQREDLRKTCGDLRRLAETPKLSSLNNGLAKAIIQAAEKSWLLSFHTQVKD